MYFSLSSRMGGLISLILLAAVLSITLLSLRSFERAQSAVLNERLQFILFETKQSLEQALRIGLPLGGEHGIGEKLDQLRRLDDQVISIEVFDSNGVVLFSTDRVFINELVSERWLEAMAALSGQDRASKIWSHREHDVLVEGLAVARPDDNLVGSVALQYLVSGFDRSAERAGLVLFQAGAFLLVGMVGLALIGSRMFMAPLLRRLNAINEVGGKLLEYMDSPQSTLSHRARGSSTRALLAEGKGQSVFEQFRQRVLDALWEIDQTRAVVQQSDADTN